MYEENSTVDLSPELSSLLSETFDSPHLQRAPARTPNYATKAGSTVPALVEAYVYNLGCLKAFELQLQAQQQYSESVQ